MKNKQDIILSVKDVVSRFGDQVVHDGVSFDVRRGEIVGVVGGSGAGKSVLLKTMTGLRKPEGGQACIMGKPVNEVSNSESASLFGVLFQDGALFSAMTVLQNIMLPLREHTNLAESTRTALAQLKLALVGLSAEAGVKYPSELSGGMTKRAALARALAMDPLILFLDEPTAGLDPVNASGFDELILELNRSLGVTVVMVTHDLDTLFRVCDRVAVLINKKVIIDTLPNLLQVDDPWVKEYFNGPRAQGAALAAKNTHGNA